MRESKKPFKLGKAKVGKQSFGENFVVDIIEHNMCITGIHS